MEFAKIWPLTCHNWVKYWSRTKNNTTNREYSARAICWSFPRSSTTLRLETPRGVAPTPPPLHRRRWQNTVYGRGLSHYFQNFATQSQLSKRCASYPTLPYLWNRISDRQTVFFDEYHLNVKVAWHGYRIASLPVITRGACQTWGTLDDPQNI